MARPPQAVLIQQATQVTLTTSEQALMFDEDLADGNAAVSFWCVVSLVDRTRLSGRSSGIEMLGDIGGPLLPSASQ